MIVAAGYDIKVYVVLHHLAPKELDSHYNIIHNFISLPQVIV